MKKMVSLIMVLVMVITMLPMSASAKTTGEKVGEKIGYELYSYYWKNGTLYVQGCVVNNNKKYDLLGMEDAVLVVTDSKGLEMFFIELNDAFEANCILRPESKRPYNFTGKYLEHDPSEYSDLYSGLQVFFAGFSFYYDKCNGKNCGNCQGIGLDLNENPFVDESTGNTRTTGNTGKNSNDGSRSTNQKSRDCGICNGSTKCHVCSGKGKFYCESLYCNSGKCNSCKGGLYKSGSRLSKCLVCGGDGKCDICNGTSYRPCKTCSGSGKCKDCK